MSALSPLAEALEAEVGTSRYDSPLVIAVLDNCEFTEAELLAIHTATLYTGKYGLHVRAAIIRAHARLYVEGKTAAQK